jgi:hypothetical protein
MCQTDPPLKTQEWTIHSTIWLQLREKVAEVIAADCVLDLNTTFSPAGDQSQADQLCIGLAPQQDYGYR